MRIELTDARVKGFSTDKRVDLVDTREAGLVLRVTPSGMKTWSVRGRSSDGRPQRITFGGYPDISLREARIRASEIRRELREIKGSLNQLRKSTANVDKQAPTLLDLLLEYEERFSPQRKTWQRPKRGGNPEAINRILTVFGGLADHAVTAISAYELSDRMVGYQSKSGKKSANGQVSRARAYLMPVLDWCAGRGRFRKIGLARNPTLEVADLHQTHDPAIDDQTISGARSRVLDHEELKRILPLLVWPAPECLKMKAALELDLRPIALRFILLTASRVSEVADMAWGDLVEQRKEWRKPTVKTTRGQPRGQVLPLSDAAMNLLRSLPGYETRRNSELVFPNQVGRRLDNWSRITAAIQRESKTSHWHRHDLRRTSATVMGLIDVAPRVIDLILAHSPNHIEEGTSAAIASYLIPLNVLRDDDPQKTALDRLAEVYLKIENDKN